MASILLVTGGVRSGKSRYAEEQLKDSPQVVYIATARCLDSEMERRIQRHRQDRPEHWITVEACRDLDQVLKATAGLTPQQHRALLGAVVKLLGAGASHLDVLLGGRRPDDPQS